MHKGVRGDRESEGGSVMRVNNRLTSGVALLVALTIALAGCQFDKGGQQAAGRSAPTVAATVPPATSPQTTGVPVGNRLTVTFSKDMVASTINTSTFLLACPAGTSITGTVTYVATSRVATFRPASNLPASTTCTATITTGAQDTDGLFLASDFTWTFVTGTTTDSTRPTVSSTVPTAGATGVALNSLITATFSEPMDPETITTSTFTVGGVTGTVAYAVNGNVATFTPGSNLTASTTYTATITTGAADLAGNTLASNFTWSFTTGTSSDTTPPTISARNPGASVTGVCINHTVNATFSEAMNPLTITTLTFTVQKTSDLSSVVGTVSYNATTFVATFVPTANLASSTNYTVTMTTGVQDVAGNALASNNVWTFTTGTSTCQATVPLNSAATFAVLASAAISGGTAGTTVNGDLGIATKTLTSITDFVGGGAPATPGTVNGTIYASNAPTAGNTVSSTARADLNTAYLDAAGRTTGAITISGNQGGSTLAPGLYKSTSSLSIDATALTLDAQGDCEAVWVFNMESTLTTTSGGNVTLAGCAQAKNVFWRVGSSATLAAATFNGNILANTSISVTTQAVTVNGRLLASAVNDGAVTFAAFANVVNRPAIP